ncbi:hypothetical protein F4820DRAFT_428475 [Hypoxylon rubiginosum]|uniref:Uncharacterized protein n=1 Tax=Hypoxylon rubiginosum TaxID=110542 RepID=A0ACB9YV10_9PEZI|nr:hypothetical protein F4820DRAFT_428475 [Hypoxylon rubiginosum]
MTTSAGSTTRQISKWKYECPRYICPFCRNSCSKYPSIALLQRHVSDQHTDEPPNHPLLQEEISSKRQDDGREILDHP